MTTYKVTVSMLCEYTVEASSAEEAERLASERTPEEADTVSIIETTAIEKH